MSNLDLFGWDRLRHGGLLLDAPRLARIASQLPNPLSEFHEHELRRQVGKVLDGTADAAEFGICVLVDVCGFSGGSGTWQRGSQVGAEWGRRSVTGEIVKPRQLWRGLNGAILPVFIDAEPRLGIGRGRKSASQTVQWLRAGNERLALLTNGRQWRLVFAGLDFDAWCEWDVDVWFEEGALSPQVHALRTLLQPAFWTPPAPDTPAPLLQAILDSRKGQAELSALLGERVREAVELLVQAHGEVLKERCAGVDPADIYRAAVRVVMRMVVVLFAESRELLPRDNALYHGAYGITGLLEDLEKVAARGGNRLARSWNAWPRVLALFRLVHQGSHHPALPVPAYGGELFAVGDPATAEGLSRALAVFETAAFDRELLPDRDVLRILERITRTKVKVRQGRASTWVPAPVDFSDFSSEYIGILYEGLLDFELKTAPVGDAVVFLAVGNQPALPLSRLEEMGEAALRNLLEKLKDTSKSDGGEEESEEDESASESENGRSEKSADDEVDSDEPAAPETGDTGDARHTTRSRAESWARRAVEVGGLVRKPRGVLTPEKRLAFEDAVARKARQLVVRVILPGEWYLVRWGGTRKGSGTFYTRPGLAVPTVQRTLRPLAYAPPTAAGGTPDLDAPQAAWLPKPPEEILALKVCDPACGSGTFPVAALRFLTEALFESLHHHGRVTADGERSVVRLLERTSSHAGATEERLGQELLPCRPDDALFEPRLKAILRRHVVERSIYGVDLDPLAVELCRLALWIETMDRTLPFSFLDHKVQCGNALVGAWFDQFQHYPVMAWKNREGGDKGHSSGVHFEKEARTKAIKAFVKDKLSRDLADAITGQQHLGAASIGQPDRVHAEAIATLSRLHDLPVQDSAERARIYRTELLDSPSYRSLKAAMNLWCACWFWPADELEHAPIPTSLAVPPAATIAIAERIAARLRFFHWEFEFPDVFGAPGSGFDAVLGNPPWENLQPNPEEFFSNADPLFRTYGRLVKLVRQRELFAADKSFERQWLDYSAGFNNFAHWVGHSANPHGDPENGGGSNESFAFARDGRELHGRWRNQRRLSKGYATVEHPYRHQVGRLFTYKLFLELCYVLLRKDGRFGQIVPSGIYSDSWSQPLRELFLDKCRWEWLFGFDNRDGIFDIDSRFKFNPLVLEKGGKTTAIRTAFVRRKLEDWERAEELATPYSRAQLERFSPHSKAILEIQSPRDLQILEKIYTNAVLLGDSGTGGWSIQYKLEFMMNANVHLFPPRPKWEADGYRPDEYSRWLKGEWRPINELWDELGARPLPEAERRCAQPPYDRLLMARADLPAGIVLSREADAWVREERVENVALPLFQGVMVWIGRPYASVCVSIGRGQKDWAPNPRESTLVTPKYLIAAGGITAVPKVVFRDITNATNERTIVPALLPGFPCGNVLGTLTSTLPLEGLAATLGSLVADWQMRQRIAGTHLNWFIMEELAVLPPSRGSHQLAALNLSSNAIGPQAAAWAALGRQRRWFQDKPWRGGWALSSHELMRQQLMIEVMVAARYGLDLNDLRHVLRDCDHSQATGGSKGFWRVDKDKEPELRYTVLTLVAFHDLEDMMRAHGGDREAGIEAFLAQNNGEGWMLPETLRLADYGLGHDERAKSAQPVAERFGPRFYDWQLTQSAEESWRECHLHARNLLGETGYRQLLADIEAGGDGRGSENISPPPVPETESAGQGSLFE